VKNVTKLAIKILQGSAVTQNVSGGYYTQPVCNFSTAYVCQKLRKSVDIRQSYKRRQSGLFSLIPYSAVKHCLQRQCSKKNWRRCSYFWD